MSSLRDFGGRVYRLFFYHNANPLGFEMSQLEIIIEQLKNYIATKKLDSRPNLKAFIVVAVGDNIHWQTLSA